MLGYGDNQEPEDLPQPLQDLIFARQGDEATTGSLTGVTQSMASLKVDLQNKSLLLHHCDLEDDERERARLGSVGLPHSGDWPSVIVMNCSTHICARWNLHTFDNFELKYFKVSLNSIVVKLIKMLWLRKQRLFPQPKHLRNSFSPHLLVFLIKCTVKAQTDGSTSF